MLIYISAATSFNGFDRCPDKDGKDEHRITTDYITASDKKTFSELLTGHLADYHHFYNRVRLKIADENETRNRVIPTDLRLEDYAKGTGRVQTGGGAEQRRRVGMASPFPSGSFRRLHASATHRISQSRVFAARMAGTWPPRVGTRQSGCGTRRRANRGSPSVGTGTAYSTSVSARTAGTWPPPAGDNTVRLWDAATGTPRLNSREHTGNTTHVCFSPDGGCLASASWDNTVRLWDTTTGKSLHVLPGHTSFVNHVCFSPDGQRLASASDDKTVCLWSATTGKPLCVLLGHTDKVKHACFSPDGRASPPPAMTRPCGCGTRTRAVPANSLQGTHKTSRTCVSARTADPSPPPVGTRR